MFQRQDLAPIAQRVLRQQPHFGQAVEHQAHRLYPLDLGHHGTCRFPQFDFRRIQDGLLQIRTEPFLCDEFEDIDAIERPAMRPGDNVQFISRFRQRDVQTAFVPGPPGLQELKAERGLARTRRAFDQVHVTTRQASTQHIVQTGNACGSAKFRKVWNLVSSLIFHARFPRLNAKAEPFNLRGAGLQS